MTLLLDDFLYVLPFEHLPGLEIVPAISRDTTLFYVSRKLEEMGYQPDLNNSAGFGADKGKYFSYDFKNPAVNFKHLAIDITKQNSSLKFEGNDSMTRYPSLIDYNKAFTEPGFMQVYGIIDFLNHVKFNTLMQSVGYSRLKLLIVHDQLNWKKSILNKFIDLNCESETTELEEQDLVLTTAMNLMNISLVKNRWTSTAEVVVSNIATIYKNLGSGSYLGSIHQQEGSTII